MTTTKDEEFAKKKLKLIKREHKKGNKAAVRRHTKELYDYFGFEY